MESTLARLAVGRGGLPALAFVASHQALLPRAKALWGEYDAGGSPRWRSAIAVPMQLALLPVLIAYAFAAGGGTMAGWRARWEADWNSAQASGACPAEWAFVNIFAAFLLVDFVNYRIRTVMIAHHVVCLIGHFGALSAPAAFVDYFAAAVACELGSAVCNLNALYPRSGAALAAYVAGMTLSNGLALAALLSWARALGGASLGLRVAMSTLTLPLLAERQRTCIREWRRFGKED